MPLVSSSTARRFRFLHIQLVLACAAFLGYVVVTSIYRKKIDERTMWEIRQEELKKYDAPEVGLPYVRQIGQTYRNVKDLTGDQINAMNDTELMVTVNGFLDNADIICARKLRMGFVSDGGWEVCEDTPVSLSISSCLVYSFQVSLQFDFQDDISRVYGCDVHSFNPNLSGLDYNRSDKVTVHPYGIARESYVDTDGREFYSLSDIRSILGHLNRRIDVIRMSLEGGEWPVLYDSAYLKDMKKVKQLFIEFQVGYPPIPDRHRRMLRVLRAINELGFRKFYVRKRARGAYHHPDFPVLQAKRYEVHYMNTKLS